MANQNSTLHVTEQSAKRLKSGSIKDNNNTATANIPLSNRYDVLSEDENEEETPMDTNTSQEGRDNRAPHSSKPNQPPSKPKTPPPISILGITDYKLFTNTLATQLKGEFTITPREDNIRVKTSNIEDYRILANILNTKNLNYHTWATEDNHNRKYVIRGLPRNITTQEISEDLTKQGYKVTKISQLLTHNKERTPLPLFAVTLPTKENEKQIADLTRLCYCRVRVESFRGDKGPKQCFNCQRFGHTALFCKHIPRCFKCAGNHQGKDCLKTKDVPCLCVNCNEAHPASYRKCQTYLTVKESSYQRPKVKPTVQNTTKVIPEPRRTERNTSYSEILKNPKKTTVWINPENKKEEPVHQEEIIWTTISQIADTISKLDTSPLIKTLTQLLIELIKNRNQNGSP